MIRWLLIIGAALSILGGIVYAADSDGYHRAAAKYEAQLRKDKAAASEALRVAMLADIEKYKAQTRSVANLSEQLINANQTIDQQKNKLAQRSHDVSTQFRVKAGEPLTAVPGWLVTNGWVCDYNRAIGYGVQQSGASVSGVESDPCQADPFTPSTVTGEEILQHHEAYGAYTQKLEGQVARLIDYAMTVSGEKP